MNSNTLARDVSKICAISARVIPVLITMTLDAEDIMMSRSSRL